MNKTHANILSGLRLFHPRGPIAAAEFRFTIIDVVIMLTIILPTACMIVFCLWRYRRSRAAKFDPEFTRSRPLEIAMWGVPLVTVAVLGFFSWQGVFRVNPYGPSALNRRHGLAVMPPGLNATRPLRINVVATDWQWLFIYPNQHIATLNTLVVPQNRNIDFRLTATSVVNDFYIPQLIGMIDVMPGMRTKDAMRADRIGVWNGFSADISGAGLSWMRFKTHVVSPRDFKTWVAATRARVHHLSYAKFETIAQPTIDLNDKPSYFSQVSPHLFSRIVTAAMNGKIYPVPMALTKKMAKDVARNAPYLAGRSHS